MNDVPTLDPAHTALIVMDYQNGILGRFGDDAQPLLARAAAAIELVRDRGGHVGYVRVAFTDADFEAMPVTSGMGTRLASGREGVHADSPNTQIHQAIEPGDGDIVVRKTRVGAFSTTDLGEQLAQRGVDTLLLAGISTSGCVLSTVRDAYDRDYRLLVVADLCADPEPGVHEFLTERLFPRQTQVVTAADLDALLSERG